MKARVKTLLHLARFSAENALAENVPAGMTIRGIANASNVSVEHAGRVVSELIAEGQVTCVGVKYPLIETRRPQPVRAFILTDQGKQQAQKCQRNANFWGWY